MRWFNFDRVGRANDIKINIVHAPEKEYDVFISYYIEPKLAEVIML
jgi:hypothetical protein